MTDPIDISSVEITPEQFAELVRNTPDAEIESGMRAAGIDVVLDRIFQGMQERFAPDKAAGVDADIQWVVTDQGNDYPYQVAIRNGTCAASRGRSASPKVTLTAALVPFLRLIAGQENGVQLFMKGALKVGGDLMFSQRVQTFFATP
ncbi:MAG: SCP2 sterol-binding domain-containing protein [Actinobacteria bacterium]|nr:MAG: SCP2 sterol-binding domain-containing protein [Actinomycetota bacterium]